jgi:hypothetical protein
MVIATNEFEDARFMERLRLPSTHICYAVEDVSGKCFSCSLNPPLFSAAQLLDQSIRGDLDK